MSRISRAAIDTFFTADAFAVIGVSANQRKFGNVVYRTMKEKGAVVFPVHRTLDQVEGDACFKNVAALPQEVGAVVTVVPPTATRDVVKDCAARGIKKVWMQPGSQSPEAIAEARQAGMDVVSGECILMFLEPVRGAHGVHRFLKKLTRTYPR